MTNFISLYKINLMGFNKVLVSIIIPVFNVEQFIAATIESVLSQNLKNIEVIIVDDGSCDNSLKICQRYAIIDKRIQIIIQDNQGVSIARNQGLLHAKGEYVFFMDSDDTIDVEFVNSSYRIAKESNSDIVIAGDYYCKRLPNLSALPTCAQFIKNEFLIANSDVRFPEGIQPCEDGLLSHQLLALTKNISKNPFAVYHYREHENQNHHKINENAQKVLLQIPKWFEILDVFYLKNNLYDSHALHLALFLEHEPFELRYLAMPLDDNQKEFLHNLIISFYKKSVIPFLSNEDKKKLSKPFLVFLKSKNHSQFDAFYKRHLWNLRMQMNIKILIYKIKLKLVNIIPVSKLRKRLRATIKLEV